MAKVFKFSKIQNCQLLYQLNRCLLQFLLSISNNNQQFKFQQMIQQEYSENQIVWAKIIGYPWWPGAINKKIVIEKDNKMRYEYIVNFIGEDSYCCLSQKKIAKFRQNYNIFKEKGLLTKHFRESLEVAENIVNGNIDLEEYLCSLKKKNQNLIKRLERKKKSLKIQNEFDESQPFIIHHHSLSLSREEKRLKLINTINIQDQQKSNQQLEQKQISQQQLNYINEENIMAYLSSGIIQKIQKKYNMKQEEAIRIKNKLKKLLLLKYFRQTDQREQFFKFQKFKKLEKLKKIKKLEKKQKKIEKKSKTIHKQKKLKFNNNEIEAHCIRKIYTLINPNSFLFEKTKIRQTIIFIIKKFQEVYEIRSPQFIHAFLDLIRWINEHQDNIISLQNYCETFQCSNKHIFQESSDEKLKHSQETQVAND